MAVPITAPFAKQAAALAIMASQSRYPPSEGDQLAATGQGNGIVKGAVPGLIRHLA